MSLHAMATAVISTAVVSAGATTVVNQMVSYRWRRTRRRLGLLFGRGDARAGAIVETELEAYAELVARAKGTENLALRRHLGTIIAARLRGFAAAASPAAVAELRRLLADLETTGTFPEGVDIEAALAAEPSPETVDLTETELERRGGIAWRDGDFVMAKHDYELALSKARQAADGPAEARALNNLGTTYDRLGDSERAGDHFAHAIDRYRSIADRHGEAEALTNLGLVLRRQGRYRQAAVELRRALNLHRDTGDRFGQAGVLAIMGELRRVSGNLPEALSTHRQALELYRELSRADAEAACHNDCAATLLELDHPEAALTAYANALTVAQRVGADVERGRAHDGIATILYSQDDRIGARVHWSLALHLLRDLDADRAETVGARLRQLD